METDNNNKDKYNDKGNGNDDDEYSISKSDPDNSLENIQSELKKAREEVEYYHKLYDDTLNKLKYSLADFDNFRKSIEKQNSLKILSIKADLLVAIINIREDFIRALSTIKQKEASSATIEGLKNILKNIDIFLEKEGVREIKALNEPFDPNVHDIIGFSTNNDDIEENMITKEIRKGYLLNEKVLRPSLVEVSKKIIKNIDKDNDNTKRDEVK
jgi:molecular chaperone GrpE